jgi:hypothetical protein
MTGSCRMRLVTGLSWQKCLACKPVHPFCYFPVSKQESTGNPVLYPALCRPVPPCPAFGLLPTLCREPLVGPFFCLVVPRAPCRPFWPARLQLTLTLARGRVT